jgi:hypothetical protein
LRAARRNQGEQSVTSPVQPGREALGGNANCRDEAVLVSIAAEGFGPLPDDHLELEWMHGECPFISY